MKKRLSMVTILISLVLMVGASCHRVPVSAAERTAPPYILDVRRDCILDIRTDATQKTAGTKLSVYQVGRIDATSLSLSFVLNEPFTDAKVDLMAEGNTQRRKAIEILCEYISKNQLKPAKVAVLDENGAAQLKVQQGAYLICQTGDGETKIQPTLVGVPFVSESLDEWIYKMTVQLKAVAEPVPTGDLHDPVGYVSLAVAAIILLALLMFARRRSEK